MEKGQGSVSLLGGAALLLACAVKNPLSGLCSPLGLPGSGLWVLAVQPCSSRCLLSERVCAGFLSKVRISVGG